MSSALPRRDSFPLDHQVPEYSCVVLLVPGRGFVAPAALGDHPDQRTVDDASRLAPCPDGETVSPSTRRFGSAFRGRVRFRQPVVAARMRWAARCQCTKAISSRRDSLQRGKPDLSQKILRGSRGNNARSVAHVAARCSQGDGEQLRPARLIEERLDCLKQHVAILFHDDRVGALGQHDVALTGRADEQRE